MGTARGSRIPPWSAHKHAHWRTNSCRCWGGGTPRKSPRRHLGSRPPWSSPGYWSDGGTYCCLIQAGPWNHGPGSGCRSRCLCRTRSELRSASAGCPARGGMVRMGSRTCLRMGSWSKSARRGMVGVTKCAIGVDQHLGEGRAGFRSRDEARLAAFDFITGLLPDLEDMAPISLLKEGAGAGYAISLATSSH